MTDPRIFSHKHRELLRLTLMGVAAIFSWLGIWRAFLPIDLVALCSTLIGGYPIYKETLQSIRHKKINMEVSMALAIFASLMIGQFTAAAAIAFFVILAELLEEMVVDKGRATLLKLEASIPKTALVKRNGAELVADLQTLSLGEVVVVRDGERIPVDGVIVRGSAFVNQGSITGETVSVEKDVGNRVFAGSVDESGLLEVRIESIGKETVFGKIVELVQEAESQKAPIQKISDRLATWLVEFAILFSIVTFVVTRNLASAISVIVVAGACGVAAGTPLAMVATMGNAAKRGVIVKGGTYIEEMSRVDTVVIDKTGTLTFGEPEVTDVTSVNNCDRQQLLQFATTAERYSNHPIANAIVEEAAELGIMPSEHSTFSYTPGKGVEVESNGDKILVGNSTLLKDNGITISTQASAEASERAAEGKTVVYVAHKQKVCGLIAIADRIRDESLTAIADLKRIGIRTIMLTGDNKVAAQIVANEVGIDEVYAELLPQDKVTIIKRLVAEGHKVAMVGDGINDAPALAYANVGIAMGAGTDVTIEEADIVLLTNDLQKISYLVKASKRAYGTVMQNFYGTITVDGIGVALAFLGFLNPLLAAGIHVLSEFVFILNSAKLSR
ncbi:MAG TPA: cation-translocating P-type ATPase [Candidatus Bathyarchaeia archaeon]|nr:cation-translocating P-type ATPase [Candidatus Bathyarchaeia archaeon]